MISQLRKKEEIFWFRFEAINLSSISFFFFIVASDSRYSRVKLMPSLIATKMAERIATTRAAIANGSIFKLPNHLFMILINSFGSAIILPHFLHLVTSNGSYMGIINFHL